MDAIGNSLKAEVISSESSKFSDGTTNYNLGLRIQGKIGFLWSRTAYKVGEWVDLEVRTNKDHQFVLRVKNNG